MQSSQHNWLQFSIFNATIQGSFSVIIIPTQTFQVLGLTWHSLTVYIHVCNVWFKPLLCAHTAGFEVTADLQPFSSCENSKMHRKPSPEQWLWSYYKEYVEARALQVSTCFCFCLHQEENRTKIKLVLPSQHFVHLIHALWIQISLDY